MLLERLSEAIKRPLFGTNQYIWFRHNRLGNDVFWQSKSGLYRYSCVYTSYFQLVVIWILSDIERSGAILNAMKNWSYTNLNSYYTYSIAFYILVCLTVILWPSFGRIKLGSDPNGKPEFSNFSWFSMIFGAGIGIGVSTYSAAEPLWHLAFGKQP